MKMKKRLLACMLVLIIVLSIILVGCGNNNSKGESSTGVSNSKNANNGKRELVRIAWLGLSPNDTVDPISGITFKGSYLFKELLEEKIPEAEIQFIEIPGTNWIQKMETTIKSGEADIGWYTNQVLAAEWFVDHRQFMAKDPEFTEETFEKLFIPVAKHYTRYHTFDFPDKAGAIYGLPYDVACYYIMYDKKLLEQWGVEPPSERPTFKELLEIASKTTGKNPVTGKQNYGGYIRTYWCEWLGVGADIYRPLSMSEMDISKLDISKYVDYVLESEEVLDYFQFLIDFIKYCPPGITSDSGKEKWLTPDNDIAVMLDTSATGVYYNHYLAGNKEVTDRFVPIFLPIGEQGVSGFPEVHHVAVTYNAKNPDLAWKVVKTIATDKDVLNLIFEHYSPSQVPALVDTSGLKIMEDKFAKARYEDRLQHSLITDDYWYWREPIQKVFGDLFVGKLTAEQARQQWHTNMMEWIENKKKQLGK